MKHFFLLIIWIYQNIIKRILIMSGFRKEKTCIFYPSCSDYSKECFKKYDFLKASKKTIKRVGRCHPYSEGGVDLP